jgi:hypothetical protein
MLQPVLADSADVQIIGRWSLAVSLRGIGIARWLHTIPSQALNDLNEPSYEGLDFSHGFEVVDAAFEDLG